VTLNSFYIAKYQVTQSEYQDVMDFNPALGMEQATIILFII